MNLETLNKHYSFVDGHEAKITRTPIGMGIESNRIESGEKEFIEPLRELSTAYGVTSDIRIHIFSCLFCRE